MKFEIFNSDKHHGFFFRIVARNGQIVAQSEGYSTKQAAMKTVKSIIRSVGASRIVDLTAQ